MAIAFLIREGVERLLEAVRVRALGLRERLEPVRDFLEALAAGSLRHAGVHVGVLVRLAGDCLTRHARGDAATAVALAEAAVSSARVIPQEPRLEVMGEAILAQSHWFAGHHTLAQQARDRALDLLDSIGDDAWCRAFVVTISADMALADGQPVEAAALYAECMVLIREFGMSSMEMLQAISMAEALLDQARVEEAAYAHAVAAFAYQELGRAGGHFVGSYLDAVAGRLDPALRATAWRQAVGDGMARGLALVADLGSG